MAPPLNPPKRIPWGTEVGCAATHSVRIANLSVSYGPIPALRHISFEARCGDSVALMGRNGAGKSTLLKTIAGLIPPQSGDVSWREHPLEQARREIAYLPQREEVDWNFPITVGGLAEMGRYAHLGPWRRFHQSDADAVERALDAMELLPLRDRAIRRLSGGQQQRAFIARALAQEAHVLLLDEPFSGLDREASAALAGLFKQLTSEGRLILASHHDLPSAEHIFTHTLFVNVDQVAFGPTPAVITDANIRRAFAA